MSLSGPAPPWQGLAPTNSRPLLATGGRAAMPVPYCQSVWPVAVSRAKRWPAALDANGRCHNKGPRWPCGGGVQTLSPPSELELKSAAWLCNRAAHWRRVDLRLTLLSDEDEDGSCKCNTYSRHRTTGRGVKAYSLARAKPWIGVRPTGNPNAVT